MLTHFVVGNGLEKKKIGKKICGRTEENCGKTVFPFNYCFGLV
jgi:hypothetical protein